MKKHLLLVATGAILMASSAKAEPIDVFTEQSRTNWTVSGCSMANDGGDGSLDKIIDGDISTFWHADYQHDDPASLIDNPHFFIIDRGENTDETTFNGFGFQSRTDVFSGNGYVHEYRIYTVNDTTGLTVCESTGSFVHGATAHADLVAFLADKEPIIDSEFPETLKSVEGALQQVKFNTEHKGRFVIFVIDSSWNNNLKNSAICSEFYLYDVTQIDIEAARAAAIARIEAFEVFAGLETLNSTIAAINEANDNATINSLVNDIIATADQQIITIKNVRRESKNQAPYLTLVSDNKVNTVREITEQGKWQLRRVGTTDYFRIMNLSNKQFISASDNSAANVAEANGCQVCFIKNTSTNPGVSMQFVNSNDGLNLDHNGSNLTSWGKNDEGSSWSLSFASVPASDITEGWYTIRCNRGIYVADAPGSLIGVQSADLSGDEPVVAGRAANYGSYWQIVSDGSNGWKIKNLLTEDKQMSKTDDAKTPKMLAEGMTFYLRDAAEWNNPAPIVNGVAISTEATGINSNTCMDMGSDGALKINEWKPAPENGRTTNYGSVYYFEPVSDAVVEQARQDYYAYALSGTTAPVDHNNTIDASLATFAHVPALWESVDTELFNNAKVENAIDVNSIATANAVLKGEIELTPQEKIEALSNAFSSTDNMLANKYFALRAGNQTAHHMAAPATGSNATQHETGENTPASTLNTVWQLVGNGNGTYKLLSHATGTFLGHKAAKNQPIPLNADGTDYTIVFHESCSDNTFSFLMPNVNENAHSLVFNDYANHRLTIWSNVEANNNGGQWTLELIDTAGSDDITVEIGNNTISFRGEGLSKTEGLTDIHAISVAPSTRAAAATLLPADVTVDGETATATLPEDLDEGEYTATIPMGFFTVNGKLSAPMTTSFTVKDGTTTAISEIEASKAAANVIYDLQGRRVSKAGRGIFIVNGKKVLVK